MKSGTKKIIAVSAVVLLLAASRLLKHPYNFTPITAMSIFAGCYLRKNWGLVFPLGGMLVSDFFIGFYDWKLMAAVYAGIKYCTGEYIAILDADGQDPPEILPQLFQKCRE